MSVHYKFKSTLDYDTITFDGLHISVGDLKKAIISQKRLGKITDFDLQITNAQTKQDYDDETCLIPKNTSLVVSRVPIANQAKKAWDVHADKQFQPRNVSKVEGVALDLHKMEGSEEDKIQAMMLQSTADYDPKSYQRIKNQYQSGEVPSSYRCNKCKRGGHWIKNCPFNLSKDMVDIKRSTGIPRSFRDKDERSMETEVTEPTLATKQKQEIPDDLLCNICKDLFTDAVMIPCCGSSFCDDCVRTALLESEDNECPDCKEKGSSPGSLIPNRFLRNSVNLFKNETGYKGSQKTNETPSVKENVAENVKTDVSTSKPSPKSCSQVNNNNASVGVGNQNQQVEQPKLKAEHPDQKLENSNQSNEQITKDASPEKNFPNSKPINSESKEDSTVREDVESDFEDNITIKMPKKIETAHILIKKQRPDIYQKHPKPPGIETSPQNLSKESPMHPEIWSMSGSRMHPSEWEKELDRDKHIQQGNFSPFDKHMPLNRPHVRPQPLAAINQHYGMRNMGDQMIRPPIHGFSGSHHPINDFPLDTRGGHTDNIQIQNQPMGMFDNLYNPIGGQMMSGYPYPRNQFSDYGPGPQRDMHHSRPVNNLSAVYQNITTHVGTGVIDDPLEAFNRIMKEKEKRKEGRRRSAERCRSHSNDRHYRFRVSSHSKKNSRENILPQKRGRSREQDRKRVAKYVNRYDGGGGKVGRQPSFSDRSTRSRSWSNSSHKKRSPSSNFENRLRSRNQTHGPNSHQTSKGHGDGRDNVNNLELNMNNNRRHPQDRRERTQSRVESLEPPPPGFEMSSHAKYSDMKEPPFAANQIKLNPSNINVPTNHDKSGKTVSKNTMVYKKSTSISPRSSMGLKRKNRSTTPLLNPGIKPNEKAKEFTQKKPKYCNDMKTDNGNEKVQSNTSSHKNFKNEDCEKVAIRKDTKENTPDFCKSLPKLGEENHKIFAEDESNNSTSSMKELGSKESEKDRRSKDRKKKKKTKKAKKEKKEKRERSKKNEKKLENDIDKMEKHDTLERNRNDVNVLEKSFDIYKSTSTDSLHLYHDYEKKPEKRKVTHERSFNLKQEFDSSELHKSDHRHFDLEGNSSLEMNSRKYSDKTVHPVMSRLGLAEFEKSTSPPMDFPMNTTRRNVTNDLLKNCENPVPSIVVSLQKIEPDSYPKESSYHQRSARQSSYFSDDNDRKHLKKIVITTNTYQKSTIPLKEKCIREKDGNETRNIEMDCSNLKNRLSSQIFSKDFNQCKQNVSTKDNFTRNRLIQDDKRNDGPKSYHNSGAGKNSSRGKPIDSRKQDDKKLSYQNDDIGKDRHISSMHFENDSLYNKEKEKSMKAKGNYRSKITYDKESRISPRDLDLGHISHDRLSGNRPIGKDHNGKGPKSGAFFEESSSFSSRNIPELEFTAKRGDNKNVYKRERDYSRRSDSADSSRSLKEKHTKGKKKRKSAKKKKKSKRNPFSTKKSSSINDK